MVVGSGTGKANTPIVGKPKMHENMAEMAKKDYYIAKGSRDRAQGGTTGTVTDSAWKQRKARQKQAAHTAARRITCLEDFIIKKGFTLPAIEVDDCGGDLQRDPHERHKCHFYPSKMGKNQEVPVVTLKQVISRMDSDTERRDLLGRQVAELQQRVEDMSHGLQKALWTARLQNGKLERLITEQAQTNSEKQGGDNKTNDYKTGDSEGTQQEHEHKDRAKQPWIPEYTQELFVGDQKQGGGQQTEAKHFFIGDTKQKQGGTAIAKQQIHFFAKQVMAGLAAPSREPSPAPLPTSERAHLCFECPDCGDETVRWVSPFDRWGENNWQ